MLWSPTPLRHVRLAIRPTSTDATADMAFALTPGGRGGGFWKAPAPSVTAAGKPGAPPTRGADSGQPLAWSVSAASGSRLAAPPALACASCLLIPGRRRPRKRCRGNAGRTRSWVRLILFPLQPPVVLPPKTYGHSGQHRARGRGSWIKRLCSKRSNYGAFLPPAWMSPTLRLPLDSPLSWTTWSWPCRSQRQWGDAAPGCREWPPKT